MMYQIYVYAATALTIVICILSVISTRCKKRIVQNEKVEKAIDTLYLFLDKYHYIFLIAIFGVFLFSRLFRFGEVPGGFQADEMGSAYDAQNLLRYHVDKHLSSFPVYLTNHGGGQSVLYPYLSAILFGITGGFSLKKFRLIAVLCAIPCFFCAYLISKELHKDKPMWLIAPALVTVLPVFMMPERWGSDGYILLSFITVAFYFYVRAIRTEKGKDYLLAGFLFGLTLYTYIISYMVLPLFLIFATLYLMWVKKFSIKKTILLAIPLILMATPLVLFQLVNLGLIPEFSLLLSDYRKLPDARGAEVSLSYIPMNLLLIKKLLFGGDILYHNAVPEYGTMYTFSIPLMIYGLAICIYEGWVSLKERTYSAKMLIFLLLFVGYFSALIISEPNINKAIDIYMPFMLLVLVAINHIYQQKRMFVIVISALYIVGFLSFSNYYFRYYNDAHEYLNFVDTEFGDAVAYLNDCYDVDGRTVYCSVQDMSWKELMLLTYGDVSPYDWNPDELRQGNYYMALPENISLEEDCIYIIDNNWQHVSSWLADNGYQKDNTFPNYAILYRPPMSQSK